MACAAIRLGKAGADSHGDEANGAFCDMHHFAIWIGLRRGLRLSPRRFPAYDSPGSACLAPCAYFTAENMLHRAAAGTGVKVERVLITSASGDVDSAVMQLAKWRGAEVIKGRASVLADRLRNGPKANLDVSPAATRRAKPVAESCSEHGEDLCDVMPRLSNYAKSHQFMRQHHVDLFCRKF